MAYYTLLSIAKSNHMGIRGESDAGARRDNTRTYTHPSKTEVTWKSNDYPTSTGLDRKQQKVVE